MFSDFLNNIKRHHEAGLPYVVYRKSNETKVKTIFQKDTALHSVENFMESGFIFAPFDSGMPAILLKADKIESSEFLNISDDLMEANEFNYHDSEAEKTFHINLVQKGIKKIRQGNFKKVVLSRVIETGGVKNPLAIFRKLLTNYPNALCYIWFHPKVGLWLGATPEKFLKLENGILTTNSLAGTQAYKGNLNPLWEDKEKDEQQLVTDYISNALQGVVANILVSDVSTIKAGNLLHLKTSISGKVESGLLPEIIHRLHPTPAVCGLPKESSKHFILENENYDREFYTGFLGELNFTSEKNRNSNTRNTENGAYRFIKKTTELYVNLRCIQVMNDKSYIYVGGGVTKDSDPEKEWEETINKSHTILNVLKTK